ncbi:hypothetical protein RND71_013145 [Anisodus tanguticus]|uniref:peroxidase n=1 Tax=Anisodus tanguticus TaxID=243964 RepID=A0AAE1VGQ6_9SOLA|nr:hypothetical protein RND71_013145 [Anisodus tanguticus]
MTDKESVRTTGGIVGSSYGSITAQFCAKSCPQAEKIIEDYVQKHIPNAPTLAAALLRLQFHDCFVRTEKVAIPNQTLRGFSFIDGVKKAVEVECPGVVSCADIVALVARDSVVVTGGPYWNVPTGRRDGRISNASEALANIPPPTSNFSSLQTSFASKGLDLKDLVLLSGLLNKNHYYCEQFAYQLVLKRRGIFQSDAALTTSVKTKSYINQLVQGSLKQFNAEFGQAMEKMGRIEVKTGSTGEIRKHCAAVNS